MLTRVLERQIGPNPILCPGGRGDSPASAAVRDCVPWDGTGLGEDSHWRRPAKTSVAALFRGIQRPE